MFRRLSSSLPNDPSFPADLKQLGYFINDDNQIRMIEKPEEKFLYAINKNERVNELHKEAMNSEALRDFTFTWTNQSYINSLHSKICSQTSSRARPRDPALAGWSHRAGQAYPNTSLSRSRRQAPNHRPISRT
jgi:hypothetical protein